MKRKIYERIVGTGTLRDVPATLSIPQRDSGNLLMCPYTNYIPLAYLLMAEDIIPTRSNGFSYLKDNIKISKAKQKFYDRGIIDIAERAYRDYYSSRNTSLNANILKRMMEYTNGYLFYDGALNVYSQRASSWFSNKREDIINDFNKNMRQFHQRSYNGYTSPYSLFRRTDGIKDKYIPHILAVVRPEHYMQLKLKFLLTGKIDMSMVIIFIDGQLDTTEFPVPAFKALYRAVRPKILETAAQIWRVPLEFIQENCFLPKFELKEKSILKRKEEIDGLIKEFYNSERTSSRETGINVVGIDGAEFRVELPTNLDGGSVGIMEQMRERTTSSMYTYSDYLTWTSTPFTISTGREGMELLNEAFRTELGINQERDGAIVEQEENEDYSGPGGDGAEWEEDGSYPYEEETEQAEDSSLPPLPF